MPPMHILNAPTRMMKDLGYGKGYEYDHDTADGFSGQNYFPDGMARRTFLSPRRTRLRTRDQEAAGVLGPLKGEERHEVGLGEAFERCPETHLPAS